MNVKISTTNDPFKKYWWVILLICAAVGGFFGLAGGSSDTPVVAGGERGLQSSGEQSLDSSANPAGAPGGAVDLSMDNAGPYHKSSSMASSLYQAPEEAPSSTATAKAKPDVHLADALRMVAAKSPAGSADAGWGGEKAQRGFTAPAPKLGSSGFSNVAGGGGSLSASFSGGGAEGLSAFGTGKADTGVQFAKGLGGGVADDAPMKNATASMRTLNSAANNAISAASQKSNDLASAMGGRSFDGSGNRFTGSGGGAGAAGGGGGGPVALGGAGVYAKLDSAPMNLKENPKKLDQKKVDPPAATPTPQAQPSQAQFMMQMIMTGLIGAVMQGIVGAIL